MNARRAAPSFLIASLVFAGLGGVARADPAALYNADCSVCHQANGVGAPGQYPPLKNRIDKIASSPEGKSYLSNLLLYGMVGKIKAGGAEYLGYMPAFKQLHDDDIAAILTWLSALGDTKPPPVITAADIAAGRAKPLSASLVASERKSLAALHPLP